MINRWEELCGPPLHTAYIVSLCCIIPRNRMYCMAEFLSSVGKIDIGKIANKLNYTLRNTIAVMYCSHQIV
jgi:hypothetical protein